MARHHPNAAHRSAVMAMAAVAAIALGFATAEPAGDQMLKHHDRPIDDPLWPDHLRCLVLGAQVADDPICIVLLTNDREG